MVERGGAKRRRGASSSASASDFEAGELEGGRPSDLKEGRRGPRDHLEEKDTAAAVLGGMSVTRFLRDHWQKKPLLVRAAFSHFRDPITADELAGLSCEDGVESRLVREKGGRHPWEVTWGPQLESDFEKLPDRGWTLLVQEVNRWVPNAALLLDRFAFVPNVRIDDLMVSFAAPGGSVGPHVDSYDVFLVQGQGKRRWRFHTRPTEDTGLRPGLDLRILSCFNASAEHQENEVLEPGDMLYLPPGFGHHGVAVTPCLTYSIGFRSPSAGEVWASFATAAAARPEGSRLVEDPPLRAGANPGAIPKTILDRVRSMVRSLDTSDDAVDRWFASHATRLKPGHTIDPPRRAPDERTILARLDRGDRVARSEDGRWAFLPYGRGRALLLYVGGVEIEVPRTAIELAKSLCASRQHDGRALRQLTRSRAARTLLVHLFAMGAVYYVTARRDPA